MIKVTSDSLGYPLSVFESIKKLYYEQTCQWPGSVRRPGRVMGESCASKAKAKKTSPTKKSAKNEIKNRQKLE